MNKPQLYIAIHASGMPFNGTTIPSGKSLGGSESAAYYMAKELSELGHKITIFTSHKQGGFWDGVQYVWHGDMSEQYPMGRNFHMQIETPYDVLIAQRHPLAFAQGNNYNTKLNLWWLHDLGLLRSAGHVRNQLLYIDQVLTVSEFHKEQVSKVYAIDKDFVTATTNGIDYNLYRGLESYDREPRSLVYAARPERGLEILVGNDGIMESLKDCHLYVCGYDNTTPQMAEFYKYLWGRCDELPNVTNMGALGKRQLAELTAKSMLYVYPTNFEDTSCIAAIEANAAGTPFIACDNGALPETIGNDGAILLSLDKDGNPDKKKFINTINSVLGNEKQWESLHEKALQKKQDWATPAKQWEKLIFDTFEKNCNDKYRLHRHLERHSDVVAAVKDGAEETLPDIKDNYDFLFSGDFEGHYKRYYKNEAHKGVDYGLEDLADRNNPNFKRFQCTMDIISGVKHDTLLDYGCAHGHFTTNITKHLKSVKSAHGVDIEKRNIDTAVKVAKEHKIENVTFQHGQHKDVKGKYDVVFIAEVLEHVPDPKDVIETLMERLTPDGTMLITVPYGAWESLGWDKPENIGWRAHVHHFERQDLDDMFSNQKDYRQIALPSGIPNIGHFIVSFSASGDPIGDIDYDRKLKVQSPKETLSLCMIAKDEAMSIGRTLEKVKLICDEIIVGIDETTTDNTKEICEQFGAFTFSIPSPLEVGFDFVRNLTIEKAKMDWILWIDADETLEQAQNVLKYLRNNTYGGYGVQQHHFAVEPAGKIQTDLPVRLFRNRIGASFFGFVHEHPEIEINKSCGQIHVPNDFSIMHTGYATEAIRRQRFERNFSLMEKEYELHPERHLTKFLYMRDLAHLNRYKFERAGHIMPDMQMRSRQIIDLWRDIVKTDQVRLMVSGLQFYSEAVQMMGHGIDFSIDLEASKMNGGAPLKGQIVSGKFESKDDIDNLTKILIDMKLKPLEEKYF